MTATESQIEEPSDLRRLRESGPQELAKQFGDLRADLRRMVDLRMDQRLTARLDPSDVVQDAFIEASRRLPEYLDSPGVSPRIWLRQVTRQTLAVLYRFHQTAEKRDVNREVNPYEASPDAESMVVEFEESIVSPHSAIARVEVARKLRSVIDSMDRNDREVLALKALEQLSFEEVAAELGISQEAAMKRFQRAILRLGQIASEIEDLS